VSPRPIRRGVFVIILLGALLTILPVTASSLEEPREPAAAPEAEELPEPAPEPEEVKGYTLSPEKYEQAVAYSQARYRLYFIGFAYGLLVLLLVVGLRVAPRFRDWAEHASRRRFVQALVYVPLLLLTLAVLGLPTDIYGHWLSLKYEQSIQGWGSWSWDWTKGQMIGLVLGVILAFGLYAAIRRSPRLWWFYAWLVALPFLIIVQVLAPVVIAPLFFQFEPLEETQPALVAEIERVVERGGLEIPPERMFKMKASEKLKSVSAYVSGFGASKRVVVWDTTLERMTTAQTLFVFGHEMGHYVLYHIAKLIAALAGVLLLFLYLGYRCLHWSLGRWGPRWGIRGVDDWASLPVLLLFLSLFGFFFSPVSNSFSRYLEHQADTYGLEVIHGLVPDSQAAAAEAFQILGEINLADPNPSAFIKIWLYDHPPLNERILFAQTYDPWSKGEPTQFIPEP
jgi:Zn-dependent protease with chaperone function